MGSGKSSVGKALAEKKAWDFIDLDTYIESRAHKSVALLFEEGESSFRALESQCLRRIIGEYRASGSRLVLALGGGTIVDADSRKLILENTRCIYLKASLGEIRSRLGDSDTERPLYGDDIERLYDSRLSFYGQAHRTIDTDGLDVDAIVSAIR